MHPTRNHDCAAGRPGRPALRARARASDFLPESSLRKPPVTPHAARSNRLGFYLHVGQNHLDGEWRNAFAGLGPDASYPGAPTRADHSLLGEENTGNVFAKLEADPWAGVHLTTSALFRPLMNWL